MRSVGAVVALGCLVLAACAPATADLPAGPVSSYEAAATLQQVADLAASRTEADGVRICETLADSCDAMSGSVRHAPELNPRTRPRIVCDVGLPATREQQGARMLVVSGKDGEGREYLGEVLVQRKEGRVVLHEPAFWLGLRYRAVGYGMSWGRSPGDPVQEARNRQAIRQACTNPAAFVAALVPPTPSR